MTELVKDTAATDVTDLLTRYSFDLEGWACDRLVDKWIHHYPVHWLRLAVVEALYQGRYKAISVEQILNLWQRRGKPLYRFNREFERMICGRFHRSLALQPEPQHDTSTPRGDRRSESTNRADASSRLASSQALNSSPQDTKPQTEERTTQFDRTEPLTSGTAGFSGAEELKSDSTINPDSGELPIQPFKPAANSNAELELLEGLSQSKNAAGKYPIHQFIPTPEPSDFYSRLKAVAQNTPSSDSTSTQLTNGDADSQSNFFYSKLKAVAQNLLPSDFNPTRITPRNTSSEPHLPPNLPIEDHPERSDDRQ